jgi:hypothetical protein
MGSGGEACFQRTRVWRPLGGFGRSGRGAIRATVSSIAATCNDRSTSVGDIQSLATTVRNRRHASRDNHPNKVRYSRLIIRSRRSASVKSFGRLQASESRRGTNPRCAGRDYGISYFSCAGAGGCEACGASSKAHREGISWRLRPRSGSAGRRFRRWRQGSAQGTTPARRWARKASLAGATWRRHGVALLNGGAWGRRSPFGFVIMRGE